MNLKEIKEFLKSRQGYLKEGRTRLAKQLGLNHKDPQTIELCAQALREVREEIKNKHKNNPKSNLQLKSRWQSASGQWLESYKSVGETTTDEIKELKEDLFNDLKNLNKDNSQIFYQSKIGIDENLLEISLPDFHFGKVDDNTIEEQANLYLQGIVDLVAKAKGYNISKILLPTGNDLFNSDTLDYTTTKGTPQLDNGTWQKTFRIGTQAVVKSIEYLKGIAPVDVVIVQGNHDYQKCFYLGEILQAYYTNDENVNISNDINSPRKYYKYGNTLFGYTHGNLEKQAELPLIMAVESPIEFANSKYHYWRLGHIHKEMINEYQGVVVETLPSLCSQDEWHKKMGYNSRRKAKAFIWNKEYGLEGTVQINR
jgi:predicted phosphodiesterase